MTAAPLFEPIATAISMARDLVPSIEELREMTSGDPFDVDAVVPAILVHIFCREIENTHAEIQRLEAALLVTTMPAGHA